MNDIDRRLGVIETKIDKITETLTIIAVQDNNIRVLTDRVNALWRKQDEVQLIQAHCPKDQMKWLWTIVVPMGLVLIGLAIRIIKW